MKTPITNVNEPYERSGGNGGKFAFQNRRLGPAIGLEKIGCSVYAVPPGKSAFPYHAHSVIEELFVILQGSGTLRHDGQEYAIKAGDVIAGPLGQSHQMTNTGQDELKYLAISTNEKTDVVFYPDSNKILAYSEVLEEKPVFHMTCREDAKGYYHGEDKETH